MKKTSFRKTIINKLMELKKIKIDKTFLVSYEVLNIICQITRETNKEVFILINRKGEIIDAFIGDYSFVEINHYTERRDEYSLSGIRCIHTHLNGSGMLSEDDISILNKLYLDLIASIEVFNGNPESVSFAYLSPNKNGNTIIKKGPYSIEEFININCYDLLNSIESYFKEYKNISIEISREKEKAILVGINGIEDLKELSELLKSAGGIEVGRFVQRRNYVNRAYFIGKGKIRELKREIEKKDANLVIFDEELSGVQIRNLERILNTRVIDRTQLILDIFAKRAKTKEGKLQVELAQLKYMMPRLIGLGNQMSRTGGGIGTRGPGEKKLEIDRRRIRERIRELEKKVEEVKKQRDLTRINRCDKVFQVSLIGYTNSGKSTLLNSLTNSKVYIEDNLFATLDPTVRKLTLNNGQEVIISDTVGFINKLPHDLIVAFKSTLEEVIYADLLIHVVDGSNKNFEYQIDVVNKVIEDLRASNKPIILAINKTDKGILAETAYSPELRRASDIIFISAKYGTNLDILLDLIQYYANKNSRIVKLLVPYTNGSLISYLHKNGNILEECYKYEGIYIRGEFNSIVISKVKDYIITKN